MSKKHETVRKIKSAVSASKDLTQDEKSQSIKHIDEWIEEDKAEGILYKELVALSAKMEPILAELGII